MIPHVVDTDGITVWVNGATGLLGRFGKNGIDVHRPAEEQTSRGECLYCTHSPTTADDWDIFVAKMKEHFGIEVPNKYRPRRFRQEKTV